MSEAPPPLFPSGHNKEPPRSSSKSNPFGTRHGGDRGKENFPNLDNFWNDSKAVDQSSCSFEGSSIMNMSIGAQAALNEHLRHIAKFGIDGEKATTPKHNHVHDLDDDANDTQGRRYYKRDVAQSDILDQQWDYLLEHEQESSLNTSTAPSGTLSAVPSYPRFDILLPADRTGLESIEVMTDISHDFFNSSRVKLLATPERNQDIRNHVVSRRDLEEQDCYGSSLVDESSSSCCNHSSDNHLAPELHAAHFSSPDRSSSDHKNSSFQSFCGADISRISNADSDILRRSSPNSSFAQHHHEHHNPLAMIDDAAFSPILSDVGCQPESSFSSTPRRSPNLSSSARDGVHDYDDTAPCKLPNFPGNLRLGSARRTIALERRHSPTLQDKSEFGFLASPSFSKGSLSNAVSAACSQLARKSTAGYSSSIAAFDTLPDDFLRAMENSRSDSNNSALSPISQVGSTHAGGGEVSFSTSSSSRRRKNATTERSSHSSSAGNNSLLTGRKRFRTVVPRRVYIDSSPSQFPEERDSFSVPLSNHESDKSSSSRGDTHRSLLDSFEAVS